MKRIIALTMAVLMIAALLAGCSGPEGKYVVKTIGGTEVKEALEQSLTQSGSEMTLDEYMKKVDVESADEIITIELKSDGTAILATALYETKTEQEGKWEKNGDTIKITIENEVSEFTLKGNELTSQTGEPQYVFVKK